ncbi:hypothetical protein N5D61_05335 [Pseudomonas sp. GD03842]|uniref:hypothetical protein n=1 Tax=Pseudomonas sp. GD03842 TaxID=2975385 RepID=UPI00244AFA74|nr:hypothetical protein [Pseudomonas sp. GD03842]MDH0745762.1 hypothetical protein [Pseudomonas sp. GD03842]
MSRPKNTTGIPVTQLPTLKSLQFGDPLMEYSSLPFCVQEDISLDHGLEMAADLSDGLTQLCMRLHESINDGEIAYTAEVRALAFLSNAVCALTRAASYGLKAAASQEASQ